MREVVSKSVLGKYWFATPYDESFASELSRVFGISDFLSRIISTRISSLDHAEKYLDPKIKSLLPDPFHLKDMDLAVDRLIRAISLKEKICIFADYDVDGATSSALIKNVLRQIRIDSDIYVPDRIAEGYGPSAQAMQKIKDKGTSLIITVDCGSVAFDALEHASKLGMDVVVIDHHISMDELPKAVAVINPNRLDETSECKNLAAVGVAFLFIVALISRLKEDNYFTKSNIAIPNLMKQLDIVALGTVCDVMQLTDLNRAFVAQGLKVAKSRGNIGYKTLCDVAGIQEAINCYHLGFILGPRINAGGRVGKSSLGANLLSTTSTSDAIRISEELDIYNQERKAIELTMLDEAMEKAKEQENDAMLFIEGDGWHPGVIGIVAGRLKEKYNKPTAVIAVNEGVGKASCRSIKGVDFGCKIIEAKQKNLLIAGGGHSMAAGFSVRADMMQELKVFLNSEFRKCLAGSDVHLQEQYALDLTSSAATIALVSEMSIMEPFGNGNPAPIFKFSNVYVLKADIVASKHIRIMFAPCRDSHSSKPIAAIAFNVVGGELGNVLLSRKSYSLSVFGTLKINSWQDRETVQLQLKDAIIEK